MEEIDWYKKENAELKARIELELQEQCQKCP